MILWLAGKRAGRRDDLVNHELAKMHGYLLRPLGVETAPATIEEAVEAYVSVSRSADRRLGVEVPRGLREEVLPAILS